MRATRSKPPVTHHISQRETDRLVVGGHCKRLPEATDAANPRSNNYRTVSFVAVESEQLSLPVAETGDIPGCCHWPQQMCIKSISSQKTVYRFKATPAETPAPGKEVILVYFHSVVPVPSSSCLLLKTYLFVKSVPPPRSHGLCPPLPAPLPALPRLELTWLILFPRTGSSSCLQLWLQPPAPTHLPGQPPLLAYSSHLPPPPRNTSKLPL